MSNPYTSPSISGYNSNPPPDDGSTSADNEVKWATHKDKLADPLKNYVDSINSNITTAFDKNYLNNITAISTTYTVQASDRGKLLSCSNTITVTLLPAATAGSGFVNMFRNDGTGVVTIDGDGSETINGATTVTLNPGDSITITTQGTSWIGSGISKGAYGSVLIDVQIFTSSGTWTKPTGCRSAEIWCISGGCAGGGSSSTVTTTFGGSAAAGGASGSGAYSYVTSGLGATETVTVGSGGTGSAGGAGGAGTESSFGSTVIAKPGNSTSAISSTDEYSTGSANGSAVAGSVGDLLLGVAEGGIGHVSKDMAEASSNNTLGTGGHGANGPFGYGVGGAGGRTDLNAAASSVGGAGHGYGSGGGGAVSTNGGSDAAGGDGAGGLVIVKSYG